VDGGEKRIGLDFAALDRLIDGHVAAGHGAGRGRPRSHRGRRQDPSTSH
jgi:hypothetical protein